MFPNLYRLFNGFALSNIDFSRATDAEKREAAEAFRESYNAILDGFSARRIAEFEDALSDPLIFKTYSIYLKSYDEFYTGSEFTNAPFEAGRDSDIVRKYVENTF